MSQQEAKMVIHKYLVPIADEFSIFLPPYAQALCVQVQTGKPYIWALKQKDAENEVERKFILRGTGHDIDPADVGRYVGTFQLDGFVGHLFEKG